MQQRRRNPLRIACLGGFFAAVAPLAAFAADAERLFESRVRPLLAAKCQECHGPKLAEAGLRLDSRRAVLLGGDAGPVVVPGDVGGSRLIAAVRHVGDLKMPAEGKLSAEEIATLESWVSAGVPWTGPGGDTADAPPVSREADMERRVADAVATHWAFGPLKSHEPPAIPPAFQPGWQATRIDRFIAARMAAAADGAPASDAAPRELARRLWFDLTGLPPPADEIDAFERSPGDEAYRALVERLLESRDHAEHWARKWLDLARYADTMGYVLDNSDNRYPFAWTYRDWVIGALHRDLPYDRFVTLQLAADLVQPPVPREDLAALGFLTVGRSFLGNVHDIIDDRIDLVTRGLLGLTAACARCHDHKYEPVSTADYYALHGIFASSKIPEDLPVIGDPPPGPEAAAFAEKHAALEKAVADHEAAVHARATRDALAHVSDYLLETARPTPPAADGRSPKLADGYEIERLITDRLTRVVSGRKGDDPVLGPWISLRGTPDAEMPAAVAGLVASWEKPAAPQVNRLVRAEIEAAKPQTLRDLAEVYGELALRFAPAFAAAPADDAPAEKASQPELAEPLPPDGGEAGADGEAIRDIFCREGSTFVVPPAEAMRLANRAEETEQRKRKRAINVHNAEAAGGPPRAMVILDAERPTDSRILLRGNPGKPGAVVPRRLPAVLGGAAVSRKASGRLDLAQAITSGGNPLAARMIVNWAWTHHFGRGLVETPGDLGLRGDAPSHPELLDDLAARFVGEGRWSLRWLHREILMSRTWRQSSRQRPESIGRDPDNMLLARANRRRLDWEAWRDSMLAAAGTLDAAQRGGPGVDPLAASSMHVRSVFTRLDRQDVPGILRNFDIANPDTAVHVRTRTMVPQQGLAAINAPLVVEAARRVADRSGREAGPEAAVDVRVDRLWRAVLSRSPRPDEAAAARDWLAAELAADQAAGSAPQAKSFDAWARLAQALLGTAEFQFID